MGWWSNDGTENHIQWALIPEGMVETVRRYVQYGVQPGGFVTAVLENNFIRAITSADNTNLRCLAGWAAFVANELPMGCYGSPAKVAAWIGRRGLSGGAGNGAEDAELSDMAADLERLRLHSLTKDAGSPTEGG